MRLVAFDPGGTTGICTWQDGVWSLSQIGPGPHYLGLWDRLHLLRPDTIICESFEFRQSKQRDNINLISREYIGVVRLFGILYDTPVVFQTASAAKSFVSDEKLKVMGLYEVGQRHANDATRHMVLYLVTKMKHTDLVESWRNLR
jgi:hypothetical protein